MRQPRKQMKGKSKSKAPKSPPPVTQKPQNTKLMLRVPPLSSATAQALAVPPTISPKTPELAPEAGPLHEYLQNGQYLGRSTKIKTNRAPRTKQQRLRALNFWELHPFVRYVVRRFTAASSPHTRYSTGYCPISRPNSRRATSHLSEAIRDSYM